MKCSDGNVRSVASLQTRSVAPVGSPQAETAFVLRAINEAADYPSVMISVMSYVRNSALCIDGPYLHARCLHMAI